ncbi:MAG TPA: metallophosphoesterase [Anaeromyxobacter sp.]|nr:metallophosphoesterase [Anaeromyxobacter sp.]
MLIAHVSDLHIGRDTATDRAAHLLADSVEDSGVAMAILTGDVTHRGQREELRRFETIFGRLLDRGRLVTVPGNHDRMGDSAGDAFMLGTRVSVSSRPGLHVVRLDSTGPHNRRLLSAHGLLTGADLAAVDAALKAAPEDVLTVLALHHHPLPLPTDAFPERLSNLLGWPNAAELPLGRELVSRVLGRCDLVLHGHRHIPAELVLGEGSERPLRVLNAGATTELGRFRVLSSRGGRVGGEAWIEVEGDGSSPFAGALVDPVAA